MSGWRIEVLNFDIYFKTLVLGDFTEYCVYTIHLYTLDYRYQNRGTLVSQLARRNTSPGVRKVTTTSTRSRFSRTEVRVTMARLVSAFSDVSVKLCHFIHNCMPQDCVVVNITTHS